MRRSSSRDKICDLLARYTYNGDRGRVADLAACFTEDGTLEFPGSQATGPDAIVAVLTSAAPVAGRTFVRHHIANPLVDIDGAYATARSYFLVVSNNGPDHSGTYDDRLVLSGTEWKFAHRRVRVDWQATTSLFRPMMTR